MNERSYIMCKYDAKENEKDAQFYFEARLTFVVFIVSFLVQKRKQEKKNWKEEFLNDA
jgi:hypothetical protein